MSDFFISSNLIKETIKKEEKRKKRNQFEIIRI